MTTPEHPSLSEQDLEINETWRGILLGTDPLLRRGRAIFRLLPSPPRCKMCHAPFGGIGSVVMRLLGKTPWKRNPRICGFCGRWALRKGPGGAEVPLSLLFADVRGSTPIAEQMSATAYGNLIGRFFKVATDVFVETGAIIDQLVGDEAIGLYLPAYAGEDHSRQAVCAAWSLLGATGHGTDREPWIPIGIGVHTGPTFVGTVGSEDTFTDFTALGDTVNTTARLSGAAGIGEVLVSTDAARDAGLVTEGLERRTLELKGKSAAFDVVVVRSEPAFEPTTPAGG